MRSSSFLTITVRFDRSSGMPRRLPRVRPNSPQAQWVLDHNEAAGRGTNTLPSLRHFTSRWLRPTALPAYWRFNRPTPVTCCRPMPDNYSTRMPLRLPLHWNGIDWPRSRRKPRSRSKQKSSAVRFCPPYPMICARHWRRLLERRDSLTETRDALDADTRQELLDTIREESERLTRLVENLLHMTRLSSGRIELNRQWQPLEDVIGSALNRIDRQLGGREVSVQLVEGLPLRIWTKY